jgi:hypothetical protein
VRWEESWWRRRREEGTVNELVCAEARRERMGTGAVRSGEPKLTELGGVPTKLESNVDRCKSDRAVVLVEEEGWSAAWGHGVFG